MDWIEWLVLLAAVVLGVRQVLLLAIMASLVAHYGRCRVSLGWWLHLWSTVGAWLAFAWLVTR